MEKKTIFLELPIEIVERIDRENILGDRSTFVSDLLEKQLQHNLSRMEMGAATELTTRMETTRDHMGVSGEIGLTNSSGLSLGKFNINTVEGFESLADKISEMSDDPIVRMRARRWR